MTGRTWVKERGNADQGALADLAAAAAKNLPTGRNGAAPAWATRVTLASVPAR